MPIGRDGMGAFCSMADLVMGFGPQGLYGGPRPSVLGVQAAVHRTSRPEGQAGLQHSLCIWGEACTRTHDIHSCSHTYQHTLTHTLTCSGSCAPLHTTDTH